MFRGPWTLRHGCVRYELALGGLAPQGDELEAAFIVAAALDDWLRDGWAERTIRELASALGVERPWVLNDLTVLDYHDRIKARLRNALELGWLQVRTLQESRVAYALSERPSQPEKAPERPIEAEDLWLTVQTMSGDPVEDDAGFVLSKPDHSTEAVRLSAGEFRKLRVPRGSYQARFTYLRDARWQRESIGCGEEVQMTVSAPGFPDGASVRFAVYASSQLGDSRPIAEVQAPVSGGEASASWRHVQKLGEPAGGFYVFEADGKGKWSSSGVLRVEPHPASDLRGVKERLTQLGYDCGAPGPDETPELKKALERFQEELGFARITGTASEQTVNALQGVI